MTDDRHSTQEADRADLNYQRGLFRVWIVLSVMWSAAVLIDGLWLFLFYNNWTIGFFWKDQWDLSYWSDQIVAMLAPWLLTGAVFLLRWTVRGFRSN